MIKINTTLISNFEYSCNMNDANKVFKGISFFLVLLKLPYVSFKFFFVYPCFLSRTFTIHRTARERQKKRGVCFWGKWRGCWYPNAHYVIFANFEYILTETTSIFHVNFGYPFVCRSIWHLLFQSYQWKYHNNMWKLFKVNN